MASSTKKRDWDKEEKSREGERQGFEECMLLCYLQSGLPSKFWQLASFPKEMLHTWRQQVLEQLRGPSSLGTFRYPT